MDDEKFKINKTNIIVLIVDIVLFVLVIISIILLVNSFKDESRLPNLEVTKERTSTSFIRTTTEETTTTTTTTTRRNLNSPYYDVDVDSLLTSELLTKKNLTNEEALEVSKSLFDIASKIFNTSDNSLLDIETTIDYAKEGEIDAITIDGTKYGIIYNGKSLLEKCFTQYYIYEFYNIKIAGNRVIRENKDNYYRVENKLDNVEVVVNDLSVSSVLGSTITANLLYYKSNYKEEGYTSPVYQKMTFKMIYEYGRWKINEFKYPLVD
ncbi:MAG: hypothetical protein J1F35_04220 [Erysipelotrichales bacterium]|nr:hypothetical protein [Erysipelotrichales bacterium]